MGVEAFLKKEMFEDSFPHSGVVQFLNEWFLLINRRKKESEKVWFEFNEDLLSIFGDDASGYGIEWLGTIFSYYDNEFMHEYGIPYFEKDSAFIVLMEEESSLTYRITQYSREELKGWVAVMLKNMLGSNFFTICEKYLDENFTDVHLINNLKEKCEGRKSWDYGPYDNTKEEVERWHSTRCNPVIERDS